MCLRTSESFHFFAKVECSGVIHRTLRQSVSKSAQIREVCEANKEEKMKKILALSIILYCAFVWALEPERIEVKEMIPIKAPEENNNNLQVEEINSGLYHPAYVSSEEGIEKLIIEEKNEEFFFNEKPYQLNERGPDYLVSDPPSAPHAHSCLDYKDASTIYCACEATTSSGYPSIRVYRSTDGGKNWYLVNGWYYSSSYWKAYYPSIVVTTDYVVVTYDKRAGDSLRTLRCAYAPIGSTSFTFTTVDSALSPQGRGLSDLTKMGGNTVGCVYNFRYATTDHDVEFINSTNAGSSWGSRRTVHGAWPNSNYLFRPKIWRDGSGGRLDVAFCDITNSYLHYSKSTNNGSSWSTIYFTSPLETYPDIASYGDYIYIPNRTPDTYLNIVFTTNGGSNWYYYATGRLTQYPECCVNTQYCHIAYARAGDVYYGRASLSGPTSWTWGKIDDPGVTVINDVCGICRKVGDNSSAYVSWTDSRNSQTIWGEMPATPGIDETSKQNINLFSLENSPNPFTDKTIIHYSISDRTNVLLVIYNVTGEKIRLLTNELQNPGSYSVVWDKRDSNGQTMPAGVYFCRLEAEGYKNTAKMTVIR